MMDPVDDLVAWLRAQLDVDERLAREAGGDGAAGRWIEGEPVGAAVGSEAGDSVVFENNPPTLGQQQHIAEHDPACRTCGQFDEYAKPWPCDTVKMLALPYSDRPGYQEAWRP